MGNLRRRLCTGALLVCVLFAGMAQAKSRKRRKPSTATTFSYYMLALSYAPDFCDQPQSKKNTQECGVGRHVGFVVHGLWPQNETTRGPENCGTASPVSQAIVQATLRYIPTQSLIQHEWAAHGTCTGLSAADYFAALRKARDSIRVPPDLDQPSATLKLSPAGVESRVASANPAFPGSAFRTSCYHDSELEEIRVCLNRDLSPRPCSSSAGECLASTITLMPTR